MLRVGCGEKVRTSYYKLDFFLPINAVSSKVILYRVFHFRYFTSNDVVERHFRVGVMMVNFHETKLVIKTERKRC